MKTLRFGVALFLGFALFAPASASAQAVIGLKGGIGISDLSVENDDSFDSRTAFIGGGFATIGLGETFFLQPEVLYALKGASSDFEGVEATIALDYIEIPLLVGAQFGLGGSSVVPRVFAGPAVAFETGCKISGEDGFVSVELDCDEAEIQTKSVDFGLVFGAGLAIPLGGFELIIDGRYDLGLTNVNDSEFDDESVKNRAWQFMAGVGFPVGG
jgi:hypothetical protein